MKIVLNDVNNETVDKLEKSFFDLVNVHTYIWEGTASDVYNYEICVEESKIVDDRDYTLELVSVLYKNDSYLIEIMNARQISAVEIKKDEVRVVQLV